MSYTINIFSVGNNDYIPIWRNFKSEFKYYYMFPLADINTELRKYNCTKSGYLLSFDTEEDFLFFKLKFS